jgi:hypothetical protein
VRVGEGAGVKVTAGATVAVEESTLWGVIDVVGNASPRSARVIPPYPSKSDTTTTRTSINLVRVTDPPAYELRRSD